MKVNSFTHWLLLIGSKSAYGCSTDAGNGLTVTTSTGIYTGLQNPDYNGVREFRSIPFAEPPVGHRRWRPPVPLRPSRKHHYSYRYPASCPQYLLSTLSLWSTNITDFSISTAGQDHHAGTIAQTSSEDCLSLAVWTPRNVSSGAKLPVALFIHGGSFVGGGVDVPYEIPAGWVNRSQEHIVVSINYRVNVFGFPNAAGLDDQNLGILDGRLAVEWVYANIAAFGGDPERIVLWGQSAGAVAVDLINFAYWDNPLVSGLFLQSGDAMRQFSQGDDALQTNFTYVARSLGCDFPTDPDAELECMQRVPANQIMNFIGQYSDNNTDPGLYFRPVVDERIVFSNYTQRAKAGFISKIPALVSTTANEDASLVAYPVNNLIAGPNHTVVNSVTLSGFVCPAFYARNVRVYNNLTTYRYQYAGNYTNITPYWWMGAYHASDVPLIFGTYTRHAGATDIEHQVAETMQDYLLAYVTDPEEGLRKAGWLPDDSVLHGTMVRFGAGNTVVTNISSSEVDNACIGKGVYNASPTS
ncbi:Alpha/Beta hydrolase protein [Xylariales sp. AK1849]|nr:Alpha/Beta hydrolase protein [Xylariales sp. AK1849]